MAPVPFRLSKWLKPGGETHVKPPVKELDSQMKPRGEIQTRRYVKVAPPTVHAGVGNALREAFAMDGEMRCLAKFEELLAKLD